MSDREMAKTLLPANKKCKRCTLVWLAALTFYANSANVLGSIAASIQRAAADEAVLNKKTRKNRQIKRVKMCNGTIAGLGYLKVSWNAPTHIPPQAMNL
jgi:hypothetical protein